MTTMFFCSVKIYLVAVIVKEFRLIAYLKVSGKLSGSGEGNIYSKLFTRIPKSNPIIRLCNWLCDGRQIIKHRSNSTTAPPIKYIRSSKPNIFPFPPVLILQKSGVTKTRCTLLVRNPTPPLPACVLYGCPLPPNVQPFDTDIIQNFDNIFCCKLQTKYYLQCIESELQMFLLQKVLYFIKRCIGVWQDIYHRKLLVALKNSDWLWFWPWLDKQYGTSKEEFEEFPVMWDSFPKQILKTFLAG